MADKKLKEAEELKETETEELILLREKLAAAEAKLAEKENAKPTGMNAPVEAKPPGKDPMEEYVTVTLYKGDGEKSEDVFVSVNGENCLIQRGKPVKIKRKFALVLRHGRRQDLFAASKIEELSGK